MESADRLRIWFRGGRMKLITTGAATLATAILLASCGSGGSTTPAHTHSGKRTDSTRSDDSADSAARNRAWQYTQNAEETQGEEPHVHLLAGTEIGPNTGGGWSAVPAVSGGKELIFQYACAAAKQTTARFRVTVSTSRHSVHHLTGTCHIRSGHLTVGYLFDRHPPKHGGSWIVTGDHGAAFVAMNVYIATPRSWSEG